MNDTARDITESDLLAYVDGALDGAERARVERHLAADPASAALVEDWCRQNQRLDALYGHIAREPLPDRLQPAVAVRWGQRPRDPAWRRLAASVALIAVGAGAGWFGHGLATGEPRPPEPLMAQAVEAHDLFSIEVAHPVEVRANDSLHLQAWLSKRLDRKLSIPDLAALGLSLVGGRLLPGGDGEPAAQIMYEDSSGQRLTLYVVPAARGEEQAFRYAKINGLETVSWTDDRMRCTLVGDLPLARLQAIARAAYGQLI